MYIQLRGAAVIINTSRRHMEQHSGRALERQLPAGVVDEGDRHKTEQGTICGVSNGLFQVDLSVHYMKAVYLSVQYITVKHTLCDGQSSEFHKKSQSLNIPGFECAGPLAPEGTAYRSVIIDSKYS